MFELNKFVIPKIAAEWEDVAYSLGYDILTVENIRQKQLDDPKRSCKELFKSWLTTAKGIAPKTWSTLLQRIKEVDELLPVVEDIQKHLSMSYGMYIRM